jgi:hypothetical protein
LAWRCFREVEDNKGQAENELKESEICRKAEVGKDNGETRETEEFPNLVKSEPHYP